MALQKDFGTRLGVSGNYINFDPTIKGKTALILTLHFWKDEATRQTEGALPLNDQMNGSDNSRITGFKTVYECPYDLESEKNVFEQGYDFLKTLAEMNGATGA